MSLLSEVRRVPPPMRSITTGPGRATGTMIRNIHGTIMAASVVGKCLVNVHAKSRLIPEPLRTLRSETKGQAGACPDRARAIPCKVRVGLLPGGHRRVDS